MKILRANTSLVLLPGQALSFQTTEQLWLRADLGCIWITCQGEQDDFWLQAGQSMLLPVNQHVVLEAEQVFSRLDALPLNRPYSAEQLLANHVVSATA